jgi:hypothetical protein
MITIPTLLIKIKTHCIKIVVLKLILLLAFTVYAKDNELWVGGEFGVDLINKISLETGEQLRIYKSISVLQQSITDIGLKYELNKYFDAGLFYRLHMRYNQESQKLTPRHEININLYINYKIDDIQLLYRFKYQYEFIREKDENEQHIRNRLKIRANYLNQLKPYLLTELYYRYDWSKGDRFDKYRLSLGLDWKINKMNTLTIFYMYEEEINVKSPNISNIFGLFYGFSIGDLSL